MVVVVVAAVVVLVLLVLLVIIVVVSVGAVADASFHPDHASMKQTLDAQQPYSMVRCRCCCCCCC